MADAMAAEALYAARLLSGEMPEQIEEAFRAAGVTLFPADEGDLETDCTCPDWANPCKHVAAVFYLLGERFDADPFLMFELRGRTREQIVEALRARRAGGPRGPEPGSRGRGPARATRDGRAPGAARGAGPSCRTRLGADGPAGRPPADAFWTAPADPDAPGGHLPPPAGGRPAHQAAGGAAVLAGVAGVRRRGRASVPGHRRARRAPGQRGESVTGRTPHPVRVYTGPCAATRWVPAVSLCQ